jgi:hypothetical protein
MKYSKGIMWLDDCRIPFEADDKFDIRRYKEYHDTFSSYENTGSADGKYEVNEPDTKGRFTPNLLVCDDMLNDGKISISGKVKEHHKRNKTMGEYQGNCYGKFNNKSPDLNYDAYYGDSGSSSRYYDLDKWFDKVIDEIQ